MLNKTDTVCIVEHISMYCAVLLTFVDSDFCVAVLLMCLQKVDVYFSFVINCLSDIVCMFRLTVM